MEIKNKWKKDWSGVILWLNCLVFGLVLRVIQWMEGHGSPLFERIIGPDVQEYHEWAMRIYAGEMIWKEAPLHAPGYAYFLAGLHWLTGVDIGMERMIQMVLGMVFPLLLLPLWVKNAKRWWVVLLGLGWFYPGLIYFQMEFYSEPLALLFSGCGLGVLGMMYRGGGGVGQGWARIWVWAVAGILLGLSVITHGAMLVPVAMLLGWVWVRERWPDAVGWKRGLALGVGIIVVVSPVMLHNTQISGKLTLVQVNGGFNFWLGNHEAADGTCMIRPGPEWNSVHREAKEGARELGISTDAWFLDQSRKYIIDQPLEWLGCTIRKGLYAWNWRELCSGADLVAHRESSYVQRVLWWGAGMLSWLGLAGVLLWLISSWREWRGIEGMMGVWLVSGWLVQTMFVASARYRLMMLPGLIWFAVYAIRTVYLGYKKRDRIALRQVFKWRPVWVWVIAGMVVWLPEAPLNLERERLELLSLEGEAWFEAGDLEPATECIEEVLASCPEWSRFWNLYGQICDRKGDREAASRAYYAGYQVTGGDADCAMNYANYLHREGQRLEAKRWYDLAFAAREVADHRLWYNYGLWLESGGEVDLALKAYGRSIAMNPAFAESINAIGVIELRRGNYQVAVERFQQASRLERGHQGYRCNLILGLNAIGAEAEARRVLERGLAEVPEHPGLQELARRLKEIKGQPTVKQGN